MSRGQCEVIAADLLQDRAAYLPLSALYRSVDMMTLPIKIFFLALFC